MKNVVLVVVGLLVGNLVFSQNQVIPNWISKIVYIDPSFTGSVSDGSIDKPYKTVNFSISNNTAYLFKRNSVLNISEIQFIGNNLYIADYGKGKKPQINISNTIKVSGSANTVKNLSITGSDTLRTTCLAVSSGESWVVVDSCLIDKGFRGIGGSGDSVVFKNCEISNSFQDGGYFVSCDSVYILNCHIYDINVGWNYSHTVNIGGDGLQFEADNGMVYIDNCILDHSKYGGKFALISNGSDTTVVKNSTLIGNQTFSGENAVVYIGSNNSNAKHKGFSFTNCKIIGGRYGLWGHATTKVFNCIFWGQTTYSIYQSNFKIYNSLFSNVPFACHLYGGSLVSHNNIFYNVKQAYGLNPSEVISVSHNLYFNPSTSSYGKATINNIGSDLATSLNVDPKFIFGEGLDFRLTKESPIIGKGITVKGLTFDFNNYPRNNGIDIGPYQYRDVIGNKITISSLEDEYVHANSSCSYLLEDYKNKVKVLNASAGLVVTQIPEPGTELSIKNESQKVMLIAKDNVGADTTIFNVRIYDASIPTIIKRVPDLYETKKLGSYMLPDLRNYFDVSDNCNKNMILFQDPVPGTPYFTDDTVSVVIGATDGSGNIAYDTALVYIKDLVNWPAFVTGDSILINFGSTTIKETSVPWINTSISKAGEKLTALFDKRTLTVEMLNNVTNNINWGKRSTDAKWDSTGLSLFYSPSDSIKIKFSNLDTSAYYQFSILGIGNHYPYSDVSFYTVNDVSDYIATGASIEKIAKLRGLKPNKDGSLTLKVSKGSPEHSYIYLNSIAITKYKLNGDLYLKNEIAVKGSATICQGSTAKIELTNSEIGVSYQLYKGTDAIGNSLTGTGAAMTMGTVSEAGTYKVYTTVSGVKSQVTGEAIISIQNPPTVFSMSGGGSGCQGESFPIGLQNSENAVLYQLYMNGAASGGAVTGVTGKAIDFGKFTTAGSYSVRAIKNGCAQNMTGSATIVFKTAPTAYQVTGGGSGCEGNSFSIGLKSSQTSAMYQLYLNGVTSGSTISGADGKAIDFGLFNTNGNYTIKATSNGCSRTMTGSVSISLNKPPKKFDVTGGGSYCEGGEGFSIGLAGSELSTTYQLLINNKVIGNAITGTGGVLNFPKQTTAGNYNIQATNGCNSTMNGAKTITIHENPTIYQIHGGDPNIISTNSEALIGLKGSDAGVLYQLLLNSEVKDDVLGTGNPLFFNKQYLQGSYQVKAIGNNSCTSLMQGSASITLTSIVEESKQPEKYFRIGPNPCSDYVEINFTNPVTETNFLEIYNLRGIKVYQKEIFKDTQSVKVDFNLIPGQYIIRIQCSKYNLPYKLSVL